MLQHLSSLLDLYLSLNTLSLGGWVSGTTDQCHATRQRVHARLHVELTGAARVTTTAPVLHGAWLKPGAHVNAVGACRSDWREVSKQQCYRGDGLSRFQACLRGHILLIGYSGKEQP